MIEADGWETVYQSPTVEIVHALRWMPNQEPGTWCDPRPAVPLPRFSRFADKVNCAGCHAAFGRPQ